MLNHPHVRFLWIPSPPPPGPSAVGCCGAGGCVGRVGGSHIRFAFCQGWWPLTNKMILKVPEETAFRLATTAFSQNSEQYTGKQNICKLAIQLHAAVG